MGPNIAAEFFVLAIDEKREMTSLRWLIRFGEKPYLPMFPALYGRRRRHGARCLLKPLFPGYLFLERDSDEPHPIVRRTPGVLGWLMINDRAATVPGEAIGAIRSKECSLRADLTHAGGLKLGTEVRITAGSFVDFTGPIERLDDKGRIEILLSLFGQATRVKVDVSEVEAV